MKRIFRHILATALVCVPVSMASAQATPAVSPDYAKETPLMVIRFNKPVIDYPMPLYNTISSALQAKPSAVFDIVSVAPHAREEKKQPYYNNLAQENTHKVLETLHEIGLPAKRISVINAIDNVSATEVRIFVH